MLGAWEGTERTLTQGPYTFCSTQQVFPTVRTCPLPVHHTQKCAQEPHSVGLSFLWGMREITPLGDSILASSSTARAWQVLPPQRFPLG